jgi:hypothetical protein
MAFDISKLFRRKRRPLSAAAFELFDADWYRRQTSEPIPPGRERHHFETVGRQKDLSPHPLFDPVWYRRRNPDVTHSDLDTIEHFLFHGHFERRSPHPYVDLEHLARQLGTDQPPLARYLAGAWRDGITAHPLFNPVHLVKAGLISPDREPLAQYLALPERTQIPPHPMVDPALLGRRFADRGETVTDPILHYLTGHGWKEVQPHPCFDQIYYLHANPDVAETGWNPLAHYLTTGHREGRLPLPDFDLGRLRRMLPGPAPADLDIVSFWLTEGLDPVAIMRALDDWDQRIVALAARIRLDGYAAALAELEFEAPTEPRGQGYSVWRTMARALCLFHVGMVDEALAFASELPADLTGDLGVSSLRRRVLTLDGDHNEALFETVAARPSGPPPERPRIAVYTALFGPYDRLPPVMAPTPGIDYICFTDQPVNSDGWQVRKVPRRTDNDNLEAKRYKLFPWEALHGYDYSLHVDACSVLAGDLGSWFDRFLIGCDFVAWAHPERASFIDECFAVHVAGKYKPAPLYAQAARYLSSGVPPRTGLVEASLLWRRHESTDVRRLMAAWWAEIECTTTRDQISLGALFHLEAQRPAIMPPAYGNSRANAWIRKIAHAVPGAARRPALAAGARRCSIIYAEDQRTTGTTVMRGFQAVDILRAHGVEVAIRSDFEMADEVVILTKGLLQTITPERIAALTDRGNRVLADFVDMPARPDLVPLLDGLIASSIEGYCDLADQFPATPRYHLTHTVDPRLPAGHARSPSDTPRIGYLGELPNTVLTPGIAGRVTVVPVDTRHSGSDWLDRIGDFECHYAVRLPRKGESCKPFLKGFTAAHLGAAVIVDAANREARYYLGADYPFTAASLAPDDILATIDRVHAAWGTPLWDDVLAVMAHVAERSSADRFVKEFRLMLDAV